MLRLACLVPALFSSLVLVACGGGTSTTPSTATTRTGLAAASPSRLLRDAARATARLRSYHVSGTQTDKDGRTTMAADVAADGRMRARLVMGRQVVQVITVDSDTYIRANRAYWEAIGGAHLPLLADRWVKAPSAATADLRSSLRKLLPDHLAACMRKSAGATGIVNEGVRQWHGRPVVVLRDPGRSPGTSPGRLYLSASGRPLIVRQTQTGPRVPGGRIDADCDDPKSSVVRADAAFDHYDRVGPIAAPPDALDLDRLVPPKDLTPA